MEKDAKGHTAFLWPLEMASKAILRRLHMLSAFIFYGAHNAREAVSAILLLHTMHLWP